MSISVPVVAGVLSTCVFVSAALPMLVKAARTKDLSSYSPGNLVLSNTGNVLYSFYVFSLPPGPAWGLHIFNVLASLLMLGGWLRYGRTRSVGTLSALPFEMPRPTARDGTADIRQLANV